MRTGFFIFLLIMACGQKKLPIENFDDNAWKSDKLGCLGLRVGMLDQLDSAKADISGLSQEEMTLFLGPPDARELEERNRKIFTYYIAGHKDCISKSAQSYACLKVRFNAMGLADEVLVIR